MKKYIFVFHPDGKSANHLSNGRRPLASAAGDLEESSWRGGKTYSGSFGQDERCSSWRGGRQQHLWHFLNLFQFFLGCRRRRSSKMCGKWGFGGWGSGQVWQGGFSFSGLKVARLSQSVFIMFPFSFAWRIKKCRTDRLAACLEASKDLWPPCFSLTTLSRRLDPTFLLGAIAMPGFHSISKRSS